MAAKKRAVKKEPVEQKQPDKKYYQVVSGSNSSELEMNVERLIDKGWRCTGGVSSNNKEFIQAMVKG